MDEEVSQELVARSEAAYNPEKDGGNPFAPHFPNETTRSEVFALSSFGVPQDEIAKFLDIDPKTLRRHYREELDKAHVLANKAVAQALFKQATEQGNTQAAIFWMKARAGWKDRIEVEDNSPGKGARPVVNIIVRDRGQAAIQVNEEAVPELPAPDRVSNPLSVVNIRKKTAHED